MLRTKAVQFRANTTDDSYYEISGEGISRDFESGGISWSRVYFYSWNCHAVCLFKIMHKNCDYQRKLLMKLMIVYLFKFKI